MALREVVGPRSTFRGIAGKNAPRGDGVLLTGLLTAPQAVGMAVAMTLSDRRGRRPPTSRKSIELCSISIDTIRPLVSARLIAGQLSRRVVVGSSVAMAALLALALVPHALGPELARAAAALPSAQPLLLAVGCGLFVVSLLGSAMAWRTSVCACGGQMERNRAAASYGIGSLASSLLPARAGDGLRAALFSRALPKEGRIWTTSGIFLALGVARAAMLSGLVLAAAAAGELPLWPLAALGGIVAAAVAVAVRVRRTSPQSRCAHLLDAFRALGRSPSTSCRLAACEAVSLAARLAAATATVAAFGAHAPLLAALLIVPALELASLLPLTPGNLGIASGAIAVALHVTGMRLTEALTIGIALHAVETLAGLSFGLWSLLYLAPARAHWVRRLVAVRGQPRSERQQHHRDDTAKDAGLDGSDTRTRPANPNEAPYGPLPPRDAV